MIARSAVPVTSMVNSGHCTGVFVLPVLCFRVIEVIETYLSLSHSHTGPTQHLSLMDMPRNYTEYHHYIKWTASLRQLISQRRPSGSSGSNGVARIFVFGGRPPGTFFVISPGADRIQWGGGSSRHFP